MARSISSNDNYLSRLLKYIPSEIVMVFVSVEGVLRSSFGDNPAYLEMGLWILAGTLTVLTPIWLWRVMRVKSFQHLFLSTVSMVIWMFAIGGPFTFFEWYHQSLGAVVLPIYTLLVPIITGGRDIG
ncbi:MAG: hypothetical protein ABWK53_04335 [Anaerolineales bacterium]